MSLGARGKPKAVEQLDPVSGKVIQRFRSMSEASRQTRISLSSILRAVNGQSRHAGNYLWRRLGDEATPDLFESPPTVCNAPVAIEQLDPVSGDVVQSFKSIAEASRKTNIPDSNIHKALNGKFRHVGGYLWRRLGDEATPDLFESPPTSGKAPVEQLDPLTGEVIQSFKSISDASRKTNISDSNIHKVLNGKVRQAGTYLWRRLGDTRTPSLFDDPSQMGSSAKRIVEKVDSINGDIVATYESIGEASRQNDLAASTIRYVLDGKANHAGGYHWREAGNSTVMESLPRSQAQKRLREKEIFCDRIERGVDQVFLSTRIYFQNINGISSSRTFSSWKSMLKKLKKREVNCIMLSETNLDWRSAAYDECEKHANEMLEEVHFSTSSSIHRAGNAPCSSLVEL